MLKKLIKYEFKATGRTILPLYGGLLIFAIILRMFHNNSEILDSTFSKLALMLSIFVYGFIMAAVFIATFFIIVQRYHKNLLGDEGYLMHTLPVMPYKNIISKLITSSIWSIISCIIAVLSILILFVDKSFINSFFNFFIPNIKDAFNELGGISYIISLEMIILGLLELIQFILQLYASISLGHLFNSAKILLSVVAFIALSTLEGFISSNLFIGLNNLLNIPSLSFISDSLNNLSWLFMACISIKFIYSCIYFFITNYLLKNKLNLE
ncbi:MAG TPA: ABC transporter permease [Clostridium sp.]|nr:ABC transporter permease [Clostridium sp.]